MTTTTTTTMTSLMTARPIETKTSNDTQLLGNGYGYHSHLPPPLFVDEEKEVALVAAQTVTPERKDGPLSPSQTPSGKRLDWKKLFELLEKTEAWSNKIRDGSHHDHDVLMVLIGLTGAGKTTTLLHLAGVQFDEVLFEDGSWHLQPKEYNDDALKEFRTHSGVESVTETIQCHAVALPTEETNANNDEQTEAIDKQDKTRSDKKTVVIVDGPGLNDSRSRVELEIAHHVGWIQALQNGPKNIRPVLVLAVDSFGSRLEGLRHVLEQLSRMTITTTSTMARADTQNPFASFSYVFTKAEGRRWRERIPKKLKSLRDDISQIGNISNNISYESYSESKCLIALLDDMIAKTSLDSNQGNGAIVVDPLTTTGQNTLRALIMAGENAMKQEISSSFANDYSKRHCIAFQTSLLSSASNSLCLELQTVVKEVSDAVTRRDFDFAAWHVQKLFRLEKILPHLAADYAQQARYAVQLYAHSVSQNHIADEIVRLSALSYDNLEAVVNIWQRVQQNLKELHGCDALSKLCNVPEDDQLSNVVTSLQQQLKDALDGSLVITADDNDDGNTLFDSKVFVAQKSQVIWKITCLFGWKNAVSKILPNDHTGCVSAVQAFDTSLEAVGRMLDQVLTSAEKLIEARLPLFFELDGLFSFANDVNDAMRLRLSIQAEWAMSRLQQLRTQLATLTQKHLQYMERTSKRLRLALVSLQPNSLLSVQDIIKLDCDHLGKSRQFVLVLAQAQKKGLFEFLPSHLQVQHDDVNPVSDLDDLLFQYLNEVVRVAQIRLGFPVSANPYSVIMNWINTSQVLIDAMHTCDTVRSWPGFDTTGAIDELQERMDVVLLLRRFTQVVVPSLSAMGAYLSWPQTKVLMDLMKVFVQRTDKTRLYQSALRHSYKILQNLANGHVTPQAMVGTGAAGGTLAGAAFVKDRNRKVQRRSYITSKQSSGQILSERFEK